MLYYLFRFLEQYGFSGAHMWGYISFRSLLALILSLVISAWFGEKFIKYLKSKQITETQRDASIDPFGVKKIGVPSMGGIIIIVSILVPVLLLGRLRNIYLILMIVTTVWLGFLGGMDDFIKIFKHDKEGLKGRYKIVGQLGIGLIVGLVLWSSPDVKMNENLTYVKQGNEVVVKHQTEAHKSLKTTIPFVKSHNLDYSRITSVFGEHRVAAGWILFVIMTIFVVTAVSNGANLNDGMDGMCAGNSAIIGVALGILAYVSSHIEYASYLNIMYIPDSQELVVFLCAFVGALIGFLWYNAYPAQVFMGDTGSLTIGGRHHEDGHDGHHRRVSHHHTQGADAPHTLRHLLRGKPECHHPGLLLQARQASRHKAARIQTHSYTRQLPYTAVAARPRMPLSLHQAEGSHPRVENHNTLLDHHHHPGGTDHHNSKDKIRLT